MSEQNSEHINNESANNEQQNVEITNNQEGQKPNDNGGQPNQQAENGQQNHQQPDLNNAPANQSPSSAANPNQQNMTTGHDMPSSAANPGNIAHPAQPAAPWGQDQQITEQINPQQGSMPYPGNSGSMPPQQNQPGWGNAQPGQQQNSYNPNGQPQPPYYGQQNMNPNGAMRPPRQPGEPFVLAFRHGLQVAKLFICGQPESGFAASGRSKTYWWKLGALEILAATLFWTFALHGATTHSEFLFGRITGAIADADFYDLDYSGGFIRWILLFIYSAMITALVLLGRALAIHMTFDKGGFKKQLPESITTVVNGHLFHIPVFLVGTILVLLPSGLLQNIIVAVVLILTLALAIFREILLYLELNYYAKWQTSYFRIHMVATGLWVVASGVIFSLLTFLFFSWIAP